jgi:carbamoyltransferase
MRIISISPFHDSSVTVYADGEIEYFLKEERLSKAKRDAYPFLSVERAINSTKGKIDLGVIASPSNNDWTNDLFAKWLIKKLNCPIVYLCEKHHLQHASLAFYNSGFADALVIVVDRNGSILKQNAREAESVFYAGYPCNFQELYKNYWVGQYNTYDEINKVIEDERTRNSNCQITAKSFYSIVKVYETATTLIGQHALENGKTMGLASYGEDDPTFPSLFSDDNYPIDSYFGHTHVHDLDMTVFEKYRHDTTNNITPENYKFYADYAYQVQRQTEKAIEKLVEKSLSLKDCQNICITGGYALNVVANEYLIKKFPNINFYFEPMADDSGNSIGAAMYFYRKETGDQTIRPLETICIHGDSPDLSKLDKLNYANAIDIATLLTTNKSVGLYQGKAEAGPRALGNRSILFDARNKDAKSLVNLIKKREWYRPFAAIVLEEDAHEYFEMHHITESPFMNISFKVKDDKKDIIPGVVHVDGTCRIQTVGPKNLELYNVLIEFKNLTGVSVLLNTSFNLAGEPLVETPQDAIKTFEMSMLDAVWFPEIKGIIKK